jgi:hypothetical protein
MSHHTGSEAWAVGRLHDNTAANIRCDAHSNNIRNKNCCGAVIHRSQKLDVGDRNSAGVGRLSDAAPSTNIEYEIAVASRACDIAL